MRIDLDDDSDNPKKKKSIVKAILYWCNLIGEIHGLILIRLMLVFLLQKFLPMFVVTFLISRPGQSQGLLYKQPHD